jgi:hypothetical protein
MMRDRGVQWPDGWWNICTRMMASDGRICGRWYWYAWVPSTGRGKRVEVDSDWEPTAEPHVCRDVLAECSIKREEV